MLVATVLTTALITGAARGAQAAPANKPQAMSVARRLAAKLTTSFRHPGRAPRPDAARQQRHQHRRCPHSSRVGFSTDRAVR